MINIIKKNFFQNYFYAIFCYTILFIFAEIRFELVLHIITDFNILTFGDEVKSVPLTWFSGDKKYCYWAPYHSTSKNKKAIITSQIPSIAKWSIYEVIL